MLSVTLPPIDGNGLGKHPLVMALMRGAYNSNPPKPKYSSTWDVETVINYISTLSDEDLLDPMTISSKTAVLLALATFMRVSELASLDLKSINLSPSGVSFALTKVRKSQRSGPLPSFTIKRLPDHSAPVCPVRALEAYLSFTSGRRNGANSERVFIGSVRPFGHVTGSTVGRWIKVILSKAGVDTATFSAHSTRGAGSSAAATRGVPIDSVLKSAGWTSESTFSAFYRREVPSPDMAAAVLGRGREEEDDLS